MSGSRGYFEIGIFNGKCGENVGTLWRSAYQLGAAGIFTVGRRYPAQATDTCRAPRHLPLREYQALADLQAAIPKGAQLVGVEMGGTPLPRFHHPERAVYLLGAEDSGLSYAALELCQHVVSLPAVRSESYNVAVAGSLVMFDRMTKRGEWAGWGCGVADPGLSFQAQIERAAEAVQKFGAELDKLKPCAGCGHTPCRWRVPCGARATRRAGAA